MKTDYVQSKELSVLPRLPLEGELDLTYRCNNHCRHCWVSISKNSPEKEKELASYEIKRIVKEAKDSGCRHWYISGGEPMIREDFGEVFDFIATNCISYSLNTNGTLITPKIAQLLKKKGRKMVALYGATPKVHDQITRHPGSFELTMQGCAYLKEAGAGFIVQIVPMRDNYHQYKEMVSLAESLSPHWRNGAPWLYLSARGDKKANEEIIRQRLPAEEVIKLDRPDLPYEEWCDKEELGCYAFTPKDSCLFGSCIPTKRTFHIDPYGQASFCTYIIEPALRCDLRKNNFSEFWENFMPALIDKVKLGREYQNNCASCHLRSDCRWCPAYGYLEQRRFSAKVEYLCEVAKEHRKFQEDWKKNHRRFFRIAGITIQLDSDLPITEDTFLRKFKLFSAEGAGKDTVTIRHHFSLSEANCQDLGKEVYRRSPWAIYKKDNSWIYLGIAPTPEDKTIDRLAVFNHDYTRAKIYHKIEKIFLKGNLGSLTLFPTDQLLLSQILADRQGFYLHASGVEFFGKGLLFAGHSEAGKTTVASMLKKEAQVLCDDRMIVRYMLDGFRIYGTWSHGDLAEVSAASAPLKAILFLEKSRWNNLVRLQDKREIANRLLACLVRPFATRDWWEKTLVIIDKLAQEVSCYVLEFDKSGKVVDLLARELLGG